MLYTIPNFVEMGQVVLDKKIFEGFLPYMEMVAISVFDPDGANTLSFPLPKEGPNKIWL